MAVDVRSRMDLRFVLMVGISSLFADWLYEGARSIWPQYLAQLGASLALVGFAFGAGDALGYAARLVTGPLADRRGGYWLETFTGLGAQVAAVGLLALVDDPLTAAGLVFLERFARALRVPSRDRLLAAAAGRERGRAFGIHGALDRGGALLGSLTAVVASMALGIREAFLLLLTAAGLASLAALTTAYAVGPRQVRVASTPSGWRADWPYLLALLLMGAALMPVAVPMYRFREEPWLGAAVYAAYMAGYIPSSLALGGLYDRRPQAALLLGPPAAAAATALFVAGALPALMAGALMYAVATAYAEVVAHAHVARGGATALGAAGAAYGLGGMVAGVAYGQLLEAGGEAWAMPLSAFLAATSLAAVLSMRARPTPSAVPWGR